jgi:ABC-type transport system involved in multi-copper enzyme maturation permease subunit
LPARGDQLRVVLGDPSYRAPEPGMLAPNLQGWPFKWYLTNPAGFYVSLMFALSFVLVVPSIVLLRRMAQSTMTLRGWTLQKLRLSTGDRTRKPRSVWSNPIAWREAKTKASAARASFLRYGFISAGIIGAIVLVFMFSSYAETPSRLINSNSYNPSTRTIFIDGLGTFGVAQNVSVMLDGHPAAEDALRGYYKVVGDPGMVLTTQRTKDVSSIVLASVGRKLDEASARQFLLGAVILEFAVILLIVTNAAASTVTREKEDGTLDLLLSTPITSRYYIWGKLRGLVSFVMPLVAVPVASCAIFILYDSYRLMSSNDVRFRWIVFPEAIIVMPGTLIIVAAFASILGMQMSLRCRTTVRAVMSSVGIMLGACGALGWCGYQILTSGRGADNSVMLALSSFSPFTVMMLLIDPWQTAGRVFDVNNPAEVIGSRWLVFIVAWIANGAYALAVWTMYKSMVKNFDMTIRRQSR